MTAIRPLVLSLLAGACFALPACSGGSAGSSAPAPATDGAPLKTAPPPTLPDPDVIGETLATVNGMPVGTKEFDALALRSKGRESALDPAARQDVMDRLVEEKLLYQAALAQGIDKDPKIQKMMVNTLLKQEVYSQVRTSEISEDDLKTYFAEHKEDFVVPEKVQIKRILIKAEEGETPAAARARAEEILAAVKANPSDFKTLAQRHSKGPYARRGGDVGFVTPEGKPGVDPAVVAKAFTVQGTEVLDEVFETVDGFNVIYIPNRRERVERTFQQMRGSVLRKVKADRYKDLYEGYVGGLRAAATVSLDESMIASHIVTSGRPTADGGDATGARSGVPEGLPDEVDPEAESDGAPE